MPISFFVFENVKWEDCLHFKVIDQKSSKVCSWVRLSIESFNFFVRVRWWWYGKRDLIDKPSVALLLLLLLLLLSVVVLDTRRWKCCLSKTCTLYTDSRHTAFSHCRISLSLAHFLPPTLSLSPFLSQSLFRFSLLLCCMCRVLRFHAHVGICERSCPSNSLPIFSQVLHLSWFHFFLNRIKP